MGQDGVSRKQFFHRCRSFPQGGSHEVGGSLWETRGSCGKTASKSAMSKQGRAVPTPSLLRGSEGVCEPRFRASRSESGCEQSRNRRRAGGSVGGEERAIASGDMGWFGLVL